MPSNILLMDSRQLIPRWHTSRKSMKLQFPFLKNVPMINTFDDIFLEEDRRRWQHEKSILTATELYSYLFICGKYEDKDYKDTLRYLLDHYEKLPRATQNIVSTTARQVDKSDTYTTKPAEIHVIIRKLKNIVKIFPSDAMTWVDIAFYYTLLGEISKAEKCFKVAFDINKDNSFISRSYARFLVHLNQPEKALHILRKSSQFRFNPLVASAAISIGNTFDIRGNDIAIGRKLLDNYDGEPSFSSDLLACIATLEIKNGNNKKAKKLFYQALENPSENSISQYNWVFHKHNFKLDTFDIRKFGSIESSVNDAYVNQQYEKCRQHLLELHSFQPFSDAPVADAGYISLIALNDPEFILNMSLDRGPKIHMPFTELNNLVVAKILTNNFSDIDLDFRILARKSITEEKIDHGVYLATSGLFFIKIGEVAKGCQLYESAIAHFKSINSKRAAAVAEHFYSLQIKENNPQRYNELRKSVSSYAKSQKMLELLQSEEKSK